MDAAKLIDALKNAHTDYVKDKLQSADHWQQVLDAGHDSLDGLALGKLVDTRSLSQAVDSWLQQALTARALQPVIERVSLDVMDAAANDATTVGELLNEEHFEAILEQALKLEDLRNQAIHAAMNHPLVSEMVGEMLYTGIKNFLLEENALTKLPGVSSMMKLGRKSVGKAMGGMEETIRAYLRQNIRSTLKTGEQWLKQQLTNERIAQLARDGYRRSATMKPADTIAMLPTETVPELVAHGCAIGDEAAHLAYTRQLVGVGIASAVEALGDVTLSELLDNMTLEKQALIELLSPALAAGAQTLDNEGLLDQWIRLGVTDFYDSDACQAIVAEL